MPKPRIDDGGTLNTILDVQSTGCRYENLRKADYSYHYTATWGKNEDVKEDGTWKGILRGVLIQNSQYGRVLDR